MTRTPLLTAVLALALSAPVAAAPATPFDGVDTKVRPQDDLYRNANGTWLATAQIPGDRSSYGMFDLMAERSEKNVRRLLEDASAHPDRDAASQLIGDFYASLMDLEGLGKTGLRALKPDLDRIGAIRTLDDVASAMGWLQPEGVSVPLAFYVDADEKAPTTNAVHWYQSGLGLPGRDYYLKNGAEDRRLREAYVDYMATLAGRSGMKDPKGAARVVLALETALAKIQWSEVENRDALKTYNPSPRATWTASYGDFPWQTLAKAGGMPADLGSIVAQPTYFEAFAALAAKTPVGTWRDYFRLHLVDAYALHLDAGYRDAYHHFRREKLRGLTAVPARWRTASRVTSDALGEAIGMRYVTEYFPPESKGRTRQLVDNMLAVYKQSLEGLTWMSPETRKAALDKLSKITVKIGYPDKWRGYEGLVVKRDEGVGNVLRATRFVYLRDMADAGQPVDKTRWGMTPQTVNAYYNPVGNEIVFPAAILQPPFFDPKADDAYNYGAIGAIIGHEISHGFDDEGRHYDGDGTLRDWWTAADEKAFNDRAARLVAQYDRYVPLPGLHVNGKLTLGENIADLVGAEMSLKAYRYSLGGKPAPTMDGFTGDQRFFLGYARAWRSKSRPASVKEGVLTDPHSPDEFRANGVVTNLDAFYDSFGVKPGDKMYKAPVDRIHIW